MNRGDGLADFLFTLTEVERAEIRSDVASLLQTFFDTFPPLKKTWGPTTELPRKVVLHQGKVVLQGRFDLTIGQPNKLTAGRVLVELKTGRAVPNYLDDLRSLRFVGNTCCRCSPGSLGKFYVDAGRVQVEHVDEDTVRPALRAHPTP